MLVLLFVLVLPLPLLARRRG